MEMTETNIEMAEMDFEMTETKMETKQTNIEINQSDSPETRDNLLGRSGSAVNIINSEKNDDFTWLQEKESSRTSLVSTVLGYKAACHLFSEMFRKSMDANEQKGLVFTLFCNFLNAFFRLLFFIYIGSIINLLTDAYSKDHFTYSICNIHQYITCSNNNEMIHTFVITLIVLSIGAAVIKLFQSLCNSFVVCSFLKRVNVLAFDLIINDKPNLLLQMTNHYKRNLRYLLSNDMKHISLLIHAIFDVSQAIIVFLFGLLYVFIVNWDIALIISGSFLFQLIISVIFLGHMGPIMKLRKRTFKVVTAFIAEMLNFITTIKTFSKEEDESFIYSMYIKKAFSYEQKKQNLLSKYQFGLSIIIYFVILAVIWYGSFCATNIGILVIDFLLLLQLNLSIYKIVTLSSLIFTKYTQSLKRIFDILETHNGVDHVAAAESEFIPEDGLINGNIELKNIDFRYSENTNPVLNDICMEMNPLSVTALVGEIGCGKSTLFKLLMRFFKPQNGGILIDNIDIHKYNRAFIHSQIGYISQNECHLFENRSISDNIRFGIKLYTKETDQFDSECFNEEAMYFWRMRKSITHTQIENVCKIANAHDFIMNLEHGYKTIINDINKLSNGQKHRIGIARALLLNPKILLINENGFNFKKLSLTMSNIIEKDANKCIVVIANRLQTVQNANRIYVIQNGRVVQKGNHEELMECVNGHYYDLMQRQTFT